MRDYYPSLQPPNFRANFDVIDNFFVIFEVNLHNNQFSNPVQTGPGAHPASYTAANGSLYRDKAAGATIHPNIAPKLKKK